MKYIKLALFISVTTFAGNSFAQSYSFESVSDNDGLFGFYGGYVLSHLDQPLNAGYTNNERMYHTGFEAGVKAEMYRGLYFRGNSTLSWFQSGSTEFYQSGDQYQQMDVNLQSIKLTINPLVFKTFGDFFQLYAGGGMYGSYILNQEVIQHNPAFILNEVDELEKIDLGAHALAGINIWNFEIEANIGYGIVDLAMREDGTGARQRFGSITLAYIMDRVTREVKNCKDKRRLTKMDNKRKRRYR